MRWAILLLRWEDKLVLRAEANKMFMQTVQQNVSLILNNVPITSDTDPPCVCSWSAVLRGWGFALTQLMNCFVIFHTFCTRLPDPELKRLSVPVMTHSLDQKVMAKKFKFTGKAINQNVQLLGLWDRHPRARLFAEIGGQVTIRIRQKNVSTIFEKNFLACSPHYCSHFITKRRACSSA